MKKILGLDLGAASIGWALISEDDSVKAKTEILGIGTRIIPYNGNEGRDFSKGTGESRNAARTMARSVRRCYDRYQQRRRNLVDTLKKHVMMPDENLVHMPKMNLWELRSKAASEGISMQELGRVFLMLNQKRGYKSSRRDSNMDKKDTEYVSTVKSRHEKISQAGLTIGQYFYNELRRNEFFRIRENVFPREAYIEEFDKICQTQQRININLTDDLVKKIRNEIIYYQRPLKSQKGLVSVCEFGGFWVKKAGKEYFVGPRVAPKSSPLFQVEKIWENISNIKVSLHSGETLKITHEQKMEIFNHLDNNEKLTQTDLLKILKLNKNTCFPDKQLTKGIQGNITKHAIKKCLNEPDFRRLTRFDLKVTHREGERYLYDKKTGEVKGSRPACQIDPSAEKEPLYQLWHIIYSINDEEECSRALQNIFGLNRESSERLAAIDFTKFGFGNKSARVIRNILPYLMDGENYSEAMCYAGYTHSDSITRDQNNQRKLIEKLQPLPKNSLRQPVVEKILNQMINLVNAVTEKYGKPDEIRIELARELKQSKEERNAAERRINQRERENEDISKSLAEYGLRATRNNIIKWRLYQEMDDHEKRMNAICIYCGQPISLTESIMGNDVDIEHIIPSSKLFDDSQSNKTLAHRHCNRDKNDCTAYDFMKSKSEREFNDYVERVNKLYADHVIGKAKRDKLLMSDDKIPDDFINRQLRESQYIARKAREILHETCRNVWATSGTVTAELRHLWGWDDITMTLQLPKYRELGLTETRELEIGSGTNIHRREIIKDWSKRDDNRHHAIDALTIACTKQGFIQRFNTLNADKTRSEMAEAVNGFSSGNREKLSLLEKYIISQTPMKRSDVENAVSQILISYKSGKKVAIRGIRKTGSNGRKTVVQRGLLIPKGPLSEESVYGKINVLDRNKPLKYLLENPHLILKPYIRAQVESLLEENGNDPKKSLALLSKKPLYADRQGKVPLSHATCLRDEFVIKYKVDINFNKTEKVIDRRIRENLQARLDKFGGKPKEAFRDIEKDGRIVKWFEDEGLKQPIRSVRCFTGLSAVVPIRKDESGREIGFVKPGNNHHIAIYSNDAGGMMEHVCTFWHAVERKTYDFPVIIKETSEIWYWINEEEEDYYTSTFLESLPLPGCRLILSIQQNEMFIMGMSHDEISEALVENNHSAISDHLYRAQSISEKDYFFRHHLETQIVNSQDAQATKRYYRIKSVNSLLNLNPRKVKIDVLGNLMIQND